MRTTNRYMNLHWKCSSLYIEKWYKGENLRAMGEIIALSRDGAVDKGAIDPDACMVVTDPGEGGTRYIFGW